MRFSLSSSVLGTSIARISSIGNEGTVLEDVEGVDKREIGMGAWDGVGRARRGGLRRTVTVVGGCDGGLLSSAMAENNLNFSRWGKFENRSNFFRGFYMCRATGE